MAFFSDSWFQKLCDYADIDDNGFTSKRGEFSILYSTTINVESVEELSNGSI